MSISFNISYNNLAKKISVAKSSSVGELVGLSCEKFGVSSGELYYNGKKLDASVPIRFSSLVANCKLVLKFKEAEEKVIGVKAAMPQGSVVKKVKNSVSVVELAADLGLETSNLSVSYLNKAWSVADIGHRKLHEIVGDVDNLVLRFSYVKDVAEEQRKVAEAERAAREKRERERREREEREREKEREKAKEDIDMEEAIEEPNAESADGKKVSTNDKEVSTNDKEVSTDGTTTHSSPGSQSNSISVSTEVVLDPIVKDSDLASRSVPQTADLSHKIDSQMLKNIDPPKDVIYEPASVSHYENPDEDYEFTVNHAKIYQDTIKYKPTLKRKAKPKEEADYRIRIKFPNNYLLEFVIHNTSKFGELLKKIDSHLVEEYKSNYDLKLSYPPFKKFDISFDLNSKRLIDLDEFSNHMLLMLESRVPLKGRFLVEDKFKKFTEMPEVALESSRDQLPDETERPQRRQEAQSSGSSHKDKSDGKKTPKWLKLGK